MTKTVSGIEASDVQWVTIPVPGSEQREVARKLLAAAKDEARDVRTVTGGFRVPYSVAKKAGQLGRIAEPDAEVLPVPAVVVEPPVVAEEPADEEEAEPAAEADADADSTQDDEEATETAPRRRSAARTDQ